MHEKSSQDKIALPCDQHVDGSGLESVADHEIWFSLCE
jgi:hypothetical protein